MKKGTLLGLSLVFSLASAKAIASTTLAAQSLKCGGYISLQDNNGRTELMVAKVGNSTCKKIEIDSVRLKEDLVREKSLFNLGSQNLGSQLVVVVNDEVVILNLQGNSNSDSKAMQQIADVEKQKLEMAKQKEAAKNTAAAAEAAAAAAEIGASAVSDAASQAER